MNSFTVTRPMLLIIRGVPGSGKSYLASKLAESIVDGKVEILDPDAIDQTSDEFIQLSRTLTADGIDRKFHLYRYSRQKAFTAIDAGKLLVWNQPFVDFNGLTITIDRLKTYAEERGLSLPVLITEVMLDDATAKQRVAERKANNGHGPDAKTFEKFTHDFRSFSGQGYETVTVSGADDVDASVSKIITSLSELE